LLEKGAPIWMEEPGYGFARDALSFSRCRFIPVPVDREGLNVREGIRMCPKAKAALITPSHQFPLGVTMSLQRRMDLLNWASSSGAWILEDDYDSEFRYESPPLACMQGLDVDARVIYLGSFSKVLFPALRIGYLVLPPDLVATFRAIRLSVDFSRASFEQRVLTDFIAEGHFARHLRRMRMAYSEQRTALVENIQRQLGSDFPVLGDDAAIQLVMRLPRGFRDREIAERAAKENFWVWPLSSTYFAGKPHSGFVLGFGGTSPGAMPGAVSRLKALLDGERSFLRGADRR
jgi:GntR family transcriptional regulator/MocR family aminotransferase